MKYISVQGWQVGFVRMTPAQAKEAKDAMIANQRTPSEAAIRNLVAEMTSGNFGISNDAMVVTAGGVWINGQHRCEAIIRSGIEQTVIVLLIPDDVATKTLRIMDGGVPRRISHIVETLGYGKYANIATAVAKTVLAYDRDLMTVKGCYASSNRTDQSRFVSRDDVITYATTYSAKLQESAAIAAHLHGRYGLIGAHPAAFAHYLISRKHSVKMATEFLEVLYTGRGERYQSVEKLRIALTRDLRATAKTPGAMKQASIIKTFCHWRAGTIPASGFVRPTDKMPRV